MNAEIRQMLSAYKTEDQVSRKNAMKEIIQEIVLCGLSRAGFFKNAAFYGGTALRIFYGLDRFSEDLDFSLKAADPDFELASYFPALEKEVRAFGLNVSIEEKVKTGDSNIRSAFLKGNTKEHILLFYEDAQSLRSIPGNEMLKIKLEVDTNPPGGAAFEHKYRLLPTPYEVMLYDMPSLFAGKIHAVLGRAWQSRVKGRDLYDYVFYLSRSTPVNLRHLRERLMDSGHLSTNNAGDLSEIKAMLFTRFDTIDYVQAREDVLPFVRDASSLELWSADFFKQITENLTDA